VLVGLLAPEEKQTARARWNEDDVIFAPREYRDPLSLQVVEDSADAVGMRNACGGVRVCQKLADQLVRSMPA
jgi:F420-dependent methylenetetrahydromethanopterin dehydrogenase